MLLMLILYSICNNASEARNANHISKDCNIMSESDSECDSTKSKNGFASNETSTNKSCEMIESNHYVEPKFSTKRPRGQ